MRLGSLSFYATSPSGDSFRPLHQKGPILCFEIWDCFSAPNTPTLDLHPQITLFLVKCRSAGASFLSCRTHFLFFLSRGVSRLTVMWHHIQLVSWGWKTQGFEHAGNHSPH